MFEQGGDSQRYISLARIHPSKLGIIRHKGTEYIGVNNLHSSSLKVAVNLVFGTVEWANLISGKRHPTESSNSRPKRSVYLTQTMGFSQRMQSAVCMALGLTDSPHSNQEEGSIAYSSRICPPGTSASPSSLDSRCLKLHVELQTTLAPDDPSSPVKGKIGNSPFKVKNKGDSTGHDDMVTQLNYSDEGKSSPFTLPPMYLTPACSPRL